MKLAIYGDSFGHDINFWPKYLSEILNVDMKSYALKATSIEYSYLTFKETQADYDLVVFLVTNYNRTSITSYDWIKEKFDHHACIIFNGNFDRDFRYLKLHKEQTPHLNFDENNHILDKIIKNEHTKYKFYTGGYKLAQDAMIDSVKFTRPDAFIVDCFGNNGIWNIELADYKQFSNKTFTAELEIANARPNHLTIQQNKEFASYIAKHIQGKININETLNIDIIDKFYSLSKSKHEAGFR